MIWIIITIVFIIIITVLLVLLIKHKRELSSLTLQIKDVTDGTTHKYLDVSLFDSNLESLAFEINSLIKKQEELYISARNHESQLKESIANISHDLRTPLTSILGYIFLMENSQNLDKDEAIHVIAEKANLLNDLIQNFYELSVVDDDRYEVIIERLDIVAIVTNVLMGGYSSFEEKGISPDIQLPNHGIYIQGNALACERIIQNLVVNAILYSTNSVKVKLLKVNKHCIFSIRNNTSNLSEEDVEHLFERFYTADASRSSGQSGLGLSIVKSLSEKVGAEIKTVELNDKELEIAILFPLWEESDMEHIT